MLLYSQGKEMGIKEMVIWSYQEVFNKYGSWTFCGTINFSGDCGTFQLVVFMDENMQIF